MSEYILHSTSSTSGDWWSDAKSYVGAYEMSYPNRNHTHTATWYDSNQKRIEALEEALKVLLLIMENGFNKVVFDDLKKIVDGMLGKIVFEPIEECEHIDPKLFEI